LMIMLIAIVVILTATVVFELVHYMILALLYKNSMVSVSWDDITSYCYAYPQNDNLDIETDRKVLAISHTAMNECSPIMISGKKASDLLEQLRDQVPAKEKVIRSSVRRSANYRHSTEKQPHLVHRCPSCGVKLDIPGLPPNNIGRCGFCKNRFKLAKHGDGSLFITAMPRTVYHGKKAILKDYYKEMGVEQGASPQEIRVAYRQRVREYHPDKVASLGAELKEVAERKTRLINEAYTALKENGLAD